MAGNYLVGVSYISVVTFWLCCCLSLCRTIAFNFRPSKERDSTDRTPSDRLCSEILGIFEGRCTFTSIQITSDFDMFMLRLPGLFYCGEGIPYEAYFDHRWIDRFGLFPTFDCFFIARILCLLLECVWVCVVLWWAGCLSSVLLCRAVSVLSF